MLRNQLGTYVIDMISMVEFLTVKEIIKLTEKMVEKKKDSIYLLVYKLLLLTLTLLIATANVEKVSSAMNIIKNKLYNKMGDQWLNDCLLTYIESKLFELIDNDVIIELFQNVRIPRSIVDL